MSDAAENIGSSSSINLLTPHIAGTQFKMTWRFRNAGDTSWQKGYRLSFSPAPSNEKSGAKNSPLGAVDEYDIAEISDLTIAPPGAEIKLTVPMIYPQKPGKYMSYWQLKGQGGTPFGPIRWTQIIVRDDAATLVHHVEPLLDQQIAGAKERFDISWEIKNIGNSAWTDSFSLNYVDEYVAETLTLERHPFAGKTTFTLGEVNAGIPVLPGQKAIITLPLEAKEQTGQFATHWQLSNEKKVFFGPLLWAKIYVNPPRTTPVVGMNVGHFEETPTERDFLQIRNLLKPFPIIRFMDWQKTNALFKLNEEPTTYLPQTSHVQVIRPRVKQEWRYDGHSPWEKFAGVPLETIIEVANQNQARAWVCIPHMAADGLIDEMVHTVISLAKNPPIFEFSNEIWNSGFKQFYDCAALGKSFVNEQHPPLEYALIWQATRTRYLAQSVRRHLRNSTTKIANKENHADVVVSAQRTAPFTTQFLLEQCGDVVDAVAIAPYIGNQIKASQFDIFSRTNSKLLSQLKERLLHEIENDDSLTPDLGQHIKAHHRYAAKYNLPLWGYEGGLHLQGPHLAAFNRSHEASLVLNKLIDVWYQHGGSILCLYSLTSTFSSQAFGHVEIMMKNGVRYFVKWPKYNQLLTEFNDPPLSMAKE